MIILFVFLFISSGFSQQTNSVLNKIQLYHKHRFVQFALFPLLTTDMLAEGPFVNHLSFNILGSKNDRIEGVGIGTANIVMENASGWLIAPFNFNGGVFRGWALSAIANYSGKNMRGWQFSSFNIADGLGGSGFQLGGVNIANGTFKGFQGAIIINVAHNVIGLQAGVANVANEVKGVQVGLFNFAEKADVAIGLLNFIKNGISRLSVSMDATGFFRASIKLGGKYFYSTYLFSYNLLGNVFNSYLRNDSNGEGAGVGFEIPMERFYFDTDIFYIFNSSYRFPGYPDAVSLATILLSFYGGFHLNLHSSVIFGLNWDVFFEMGKQPFQYPPYGIVSPFVGMEFGW